MDKLRKNYLSSLHVLLDNGRIRQVQTTKKRDSKMKNIKVFATVETLVKLNPQLMSRLLDYQIS